MTILRQLCNTVRQPLAPNLNRKGVCMTNFRSFEYWGAFVFAFILLTIVCMGAQRGGSDKTGNLVVLVTLDDVYRTPPKDIYIEAHSFNVNWVSEKSFPLKMTEPARYEAVLTPGVYDVFVSAPSSTPRCRGV